MKKKVGKVDISALNVPPEKHEYETAKYFANRGFDVTFIKPHYINGYIIDFRRSGPSEEKLYMSKILKQKDIPSIKTLLVITRDGNLLTIKGKFDIM